MHSPARFDDWMSILVPGSLLIITASLLALGALLLARGAWIWLLIGGTSLAFLAVNGLDWLFLLGIVLSGLLWYWASRHAARELVERRTIRISSILVHAMPKILLGLYILLSFAFYMTPASQNITEKDATTAFRQQLNRTYDTVLRSELAKLPPAQREQVQNQVSGQLIQAFKDTLDFQFCLTENVCTPTLLELLPPMYAFLFFLLLWSFGFIFREPAVALGAGLFRLLQKFHVVLIDQEDAKVEVLKI